MGTIYFLALLYYPSQFILDNGDLQPVLTSVFTNRTKS